MTRHDTTRPGISRRDFIRASALGSLVLPFTGAPATAQGGPQPPPLLILSTNDTHSRLDPFPADHPEFPGHGGVSRRATLLKPLREQYRHSLLLDAGDMFQGTPYYNTFKGIPEIQAMNLLGYDAGTIGNHEFDYGLEALATALEHAKFPFVCANLVARNTPVEGRWKPYHIQRVGSYRVGIFGLCIPLDGLVPSRLWEGIQVLDTLGAAREAVQSLRAEGCGPILCLSHLGYSGRFDPDDIRLAEAVPEIDVILGGHSHSFINKPVWIEHEEHFPTLITQQGWGGVRVGQVILRPRRGGGGLAVHWRSPIPVEHPVLPT